MADRALGACRDLVEEPPLRGGGEATSRSLRISGRITVLEAWEE
jgi:hypothetical protein